MQAQHIIAAASAATGLSDFGDPAALDGLERLVKSSNEEAQLSPAGAQRWMGNLIGIATNRLRPVDNMKKHPELLESTVETPMFVCGLPRTGTPQTINRLSAEARKRVLSWKRVTIRGDPGGGRIIK